MAYNLDDITEMIRYHLVVSAPDDERADNNLIQLVGEIERMATRPLAPGGVGVLRQVRSVRRY